MSVAMTTKTFLPKADAEKKWFIVDAQEQVLGRLATRIAMILMGKNKAWYTAFLDTGDFVIVVNAGKISLTGRKRTQKTYYSHSGYPGGLKETSAQKVLEQRPERVIKSAVRGMLPKNKLGKKMLSKLKIYAGAEHPHEAQKPEALAF